MPEIIDWHKRCKENGGEQRDLVAFLLVEAVARIPAYDSTKPDKYDPEKEAAFDFNAIEVELKINGEECSFIALMEIFQAQWDRCIIAEAVALLKNKYPKLEEQLEKIRKDLSTSRKQIQKELGVEPEEEW